MGPEYKEDTYLDEVGNGTKATQSDPMGGAGNKMASIADNTLSQLPALEEETDVLDVAATIGTTVLDMYYPGLGTAIQAVGKGLDAAQAAHVGKDEYGIIKPHRRGLLNLRGKKADTARYEKEYLLADSANTRKEDYEKSQMLYMLLGGKLKGFSNR